MTGATAMTKVANVAAPPYIDKKKLWQEVAKKTID